MTKEQQLNIDDQAELDARERRGIAEWIEQHVGGRVINVDRCPRWRPLWRADIEKDGRSRSLAVKALRGWKCVPYSLEHEMRCMQVLEANGIPVPHVYGTIESPAAFVTDWAEGERGPSIGKREAIGQASTMSPERRVASLKYMEILARIHDIPPEQFAATEAGRPVNARELALAHVERFYSMAQECNAVDALIEFIMVWLRRNVPYHRTRPTFLTGDCGQFLSEGEEVAAILDLEVAHIGDRLHDLSNFRGRHPVENMGDVHALLRHYAKITGEELDLPVIAYHTVVFLALAQMGPLIGLRDEENLGGDWLECTMQAGFNGRRCMEAMAEIAGVELDDIQLPEPHVAPLEDFALRRLLREIRHLPPSAALRDWQLGNIAAIPEFLVNQTHYGRWTEEEDLREIGEVLGHRPANLVEADDALKAFVQNAGPDHDAQLIRLFHRRMLRLCLVAAGPDAPKDVLILAKLEPILNMQK